MFAAADSVPSAAWGERSGAVAKAAFGYSFAPSLTGGWPRANPSPSSQALLLAIFVPKLTGGKSAFFGGFQGF